MISEFEEKRLLYFIKVASQCGWVQLSPADIDLLKLIISAKDKNTVDTVS